MRLLDALFKARSGGDLCSECEKHSKKKKHHVAFDETDNGVNIQIKIHGMCIRCARELIEEIKNSFPVRCLSDNQGQWLVPDILWVKRKQVEPERVNLPAIERGTDSGSNVNPIAADICESGDSYYVPPPPETPLYGEPE